MTCLYIVAWEQSRVAFSPAGGKYRQVENVTEKNFAIFRSSPAKRQAVSGPNRIGRSGEAMERAFFIASSCELYGDLRLLGLSHCIKLVKILQQIAARAAFGLLLHLLVLKFSIIVV